MQTHAPVIMLGAVLLGGAASSPAGAPPGQMIFEGACSTCHAAGSPRVLAGQPLLNHTRAITGDNPTTAIRLILQGRFPPPEQRGPWMPAFGEVLSDDQIAMLLNWLRESAGQPPWPDLPRRIAALRANFMERPR